MNSFPIHAKLLTDLHRFWSEKATIQSQVQTVSSFGDVASSWSDRTSLAQVSVRISAATQQQMEVAERSGFIITNQILLPLYTSSIQLSDRLVTTSVAYDVRQIVQDSAQRMTRLMVRRVASPST